MVKRRTLYSHKIYKAKRGMVYDVENKRYNCYRPANTGSWHVLDCWVCDKQGHIHPGYNISPVPVLADYIGKEVSINEN